MQTSRATNSIEISGFKLNYCCEGDGPTAIVVGSSIYYPRTFSLQLRKHLRMVFMDHRGFAQTTQNFSADKLTFEHFVADIETLRKKLNLEKMLLIGHSGHGHMVLEYAKKYPQHVSQLLIIAMSPDSSPASFTAADQYLDDSVCPERKAVLAKNMQQLGPDLEKNPARRFIIYSLRSSARIWYDYNFDATYLWDGVKPNPEILDHVWNKLIPALDITQNLSAITMPVLIALGRYDYWNPPHLWNAVRTKFNDITIRVFEHSGHTPQLEQPELFDNELIYWLQTTT